MTVRDKILVAQSEIVARRMKRALMLGLDWWAIGPCTAVMGFQANRIVVVGVDEMMRRPDAAHIQDWLENVLPLRLLPGGVMEILP